MDRNEFKPPKSPKLTENEMFRKNRKNIVNDSDRSEAMETIRLSADMALIRLLAEMVLIPAMEKYKHCASCKMSRQI